MRLLRRVVTGHNAQGKSVVLFDGPPTNVFADRMAEIWFTDETPARNEGAKDHAVRELQMQPPRNGSAFRYVIVPPETPSSADADVAAMSALDATRTRVDISRHPGMHRTDTIDYIVLLSGQLTMLLDEGEVELQPFDLVVQRGTNHAWANRGEEPALLLAVNIDAEPVR
jgi:mannose-6-phosphate isomerase-like protein (cupin superfamily)